MLWQYFCKVINDGLNLSKQNNGINVFKAIYSSGEDNKTLYQTTLIIEVEAKLNQTAN